MADLEHSRRRGRHRHPDDADEDAALHLHGADADRPEHGEDRAVRRRHSHRRRECRLHENPVRASQRPHHGRACRFGVEARRGSGFLPAAQFLDHECDLQDHRALRRFQRRNCQQVRSGKRRRERRARQQGGAAGHGFAAGRYRLFGSEPFARAAHCIGLCRRLRRLQSRQAVSGQLLCQGLSRGPAQDLEIAARGFGKGADRFRPKARDRRDERQGLDCGNQFGQRQCRSWSADLRSNQE